MTLSKCGGILIKGGNGKLKAKTWKKKIIKACEEAGTYRPQFNFVIETLSDMMEKRDEALQFYEDSSGEPIIEYTNKAGATNFTKNPALKIVDDLNKTALQYWRDLGLTPAGLKRIDEELMSSNKGASLEDLLSNV